MSWRVGTGGNPSCWALRTGECLRTLGEMAGRTGIRVHAYALMDDHYHPVIETPKANLVAGMKWFHP